MGRHGERAAVPRASWYVVLGRAALRWLGRLLLAALAGGVVVAATTWAGTPWESARGLGGAAAVLVVVATTLAARLPGPPAPPHELAPDAPPDARSDARHDGTPGSR